MARRRQLTVARGIAHTPVGITSRRTENTVEGEVYILLFASFSTRVRHPSREDTIPDVCTIDSQEKARRCTRYDGCETIPVWGIGENIGTSAGVNGEGFASSNGIGLLAGLYLYLYVVMKSKYQPTQMSMCSTIILAIFTVKCVLCMWHSIAETR